MPSINAVGAVALTTMPAGASARGLVVGAVHGQLVRRHDAMKLRAARHFHGMPAGRADWAAHGRAHGHRVGDVLDQAGRQHDMQKLLAAADATPAVAGRARLGESKFEPVRRSLVITVAWRAPPP